jgi:hypothetical protein
MVANDGFGRIIAARYRLMITTATTVTASGGAYGQPQQDRGRDGDDAKVSITRIYPRHSGFLLHGLSRRAEFLKSSHENAIELE